MKSTKHLLLLFLSLLFLLNSCSIEKRKYTTGYYIDWKGSKHKTEKTTAIKDDNIVKEGVSRPQEERETAKETTEKRMADNETAIASSDNAIQLSSSKTFSFLKEKLKLVKAKQSSETEPDSITSKKGKEKTKSTEYRSENHSSKPRELNKLSLIGFCAVVLGIVLLFVAEGVVSAVPFLFFLALLLGIVGFIFCIIGLTETARHRDYYWGQGFAIAGIVLFAFYILTILILIVIILSGGF